jgi:uncharacterized cupredoxin-like copper-binding protein
MVPRLRRLAPRAGLALVGLAPIVSVAHAQSTHSEADTVSWLSSDSASRTVTLRLEVTHPGGGPSALISGERAGRVQVVVPLHWTVQWEWRSADSSATHSLVVMTEREKLPMEGGRPAFDNAMTRMVEAGLPAGQTDRTTFTADQAGWYWLLCGVPGHAIAGEYIGLRVDPEARRGQVKRK